MFLMFLDDERNFEDVTWVKYPFKFSRVVVLRNPRVFVTAVMWHIRQTKEEIALSLDHDLQFFHEGVEITGHSVIKSIVDDCLINGLKIPDFVFAHTQNPIGKRNITAYHESAIEFEHQQKMHELKRAHRS